MHIDVNNGNAVNSLRFPSLNGLRVISVLFVVINHLFSEQQKIFKNGIPYQRLKPIIYFFDDGQLGVNMFFVISGFLITSLLLAEEKKSGKISVRQFYIRRTLRIFPAYYFYLAVLFVLQLGNIIHLSQSSWISSLTYTKYLNFHLDWFTAHAWSLSIEEQFYLLWPLIFLLGPIKRLQVSFLLLIIAPVFRIIYFYYQLPWMGDLSFLTRIDAIASGILIAFYQKELLQLLKNHFVVKVLMAVAFLFLLRYIHLFGLNLNWVIVPFGQTHGTLANMAIAVILMYSVFNQTGFWFKMLNTPVFNYLGTLSYSVYLWQQIFISPLDSWMTQFPQNMFFIILAAIFSYYIVERPFLRLKTRFQRV